MSSPPSPPPSWVPDGTTFEAMIEAAKWDKSTRTVWVEQFHKDQDDKNAKARAQKHDDLAIVEAIMDKAISDSHAHVKDSHDKTWEAGERQTQKLVARFSKMEAKDRVEKALETDLQQFVHREKPKARRLKITYKIEEEGSEDGEILNVSGPAGLSDPNRHPPPPHADGQHTKSAANPPLPSPTSPVRPGTLPPSVRPEAHATTPSKRKACEADLGPTKRPRPELTLPNNSPNTSAVDKIPIENHASLYTPPRRPHERTRHVAAHEPEPISNEPDVRDRIVARRKVSRSLKSFIDDRNDPGYDGSHDDDSYRPDDDAVSGDGHDSESLFVEDHPNPESLIDDDNNIRWTKLKRGTIHYDKVRAKEKIFFYYPSNFPVRMRVWLVLRDISTNQPYPWTGSPLEQMSTALDYFNSLDANKQYTEETMMMEFALQVVGEHLTSDMVDSANKEIDRSEHPTPTPTPTYKAKRGGGKRSSTARSAGVTAAPVPVSFKLPPTGPKQQAMSRSVNKPAPKVADSLPKRPPRRSSDVGRYWS